MSRLTDPVDYCWMNCYDGDESVLQENCKLYPCFEKKMWDKLNRYEDLEEADMVYEVFYFKPFEEWDICNRLPLVKDLEELNKTVFLTKVEAEAKLAELRGDAK